MPNKQKMKVQKNQITMKKISLFLFLWVALCMTTRAEGTMLPLDPQVRFGVLPNGLTYYIRHNELPKQRAEFHIAQAVGASLEEDDQNGLAHFLEHMCFNGTEHFEGKGIITYFESVGVNFGGDINAYTSLDQTVYRLSNVPTYREGIIDSALLVMHDWSCAVSLLPEEIDAERGVIREEWRTGATASRRMWKQSNALMYPGSQYAKRDVIGDTAVINNFSYDALRAYYHKWYGPDLQAIIVVGDIDVDAIEQKIQALWANVPERANRGERPYAVVADNEEPIVAIVQDAEAQQSRLTVLYKHEALSHDFRGTDEYVVFNLCSSLISSMLSERLNEITMKADAPILGGAQVYTDVFPTMDAFYNLVVAKEGKEQAAMRLLLEQIEKMHRYGFTEEELGRARDEMLASYEKAYNERNTRENDSYVNEYIGHFLDGTYTPGMDMEYAIVKQLLPMLTVEHLNAVAASFVTPNNVVVNIQAPLKETVVLPTEEAIRSMLASMHDWEIAAPKQEVKDLRLIRKMPRKGKMKKATVNAALGTTEWVLSNGVRVIFRPTDFKQDEILLSAYSEGGLSLVAEADLPSAMLATDMVEFAGLGQLSMLDLQKALAGKQVSVSPSINAYSETFDGRSTVTDLETMLQLVYLYFTAPRQNQESYETLMSMLASQLVNKESNPKAAFRDSISVMASDHSPRTVLINTDMLDRVSLERAMAVYRERFANPADFTFTFVGNIHPEDEAVRKMILTYLGGIKKGKTLEHYTDRGVRAPEGRPSNRFERDMQTRTASNRIQFTSYDMEYNLANSLNMEMIGRILSTRYLESIREREGGSYGVGCAGWLSRLPVPTATLVMQFDTDPEKQEKLLQIIYAEVDTILQNGPLAEDLQKEKASMLKDYLQDVETNDWWDSDVLPMYYRAGINYLSDYQSAVEAITAETVQATLRQFLESARVFEVIMLPKAE